MTARLTRNLCTALERHLDGGRAVAPAGTGILWNAFMALSRARSMGPAGPNPISFPEIEAYCRLMRMPLEPHHVETILALDAIWMERIYAREKLPPDTKIAPRVSSHALTPALFDLATG